MGFKHQSQRVATVCAGLLGGAGLHNPTAKCVCRGKAQKGGAHRRPFEAGGIKYLFLCVGGGLGCSCVGVFGEGAAVGFLQVSGL